MWNVLQINFNLIYIRTEFTVDMWMTSGSTHLTTLNVWSGKVWFERSERKPVSVL